jgi:hypothetical protein
VYLCHATLLQTYDLQIPTLDRYLPPFPVLSLPFPYFIARRRIPDLNLLNFSRIYDLKTLIFSLTDVPLERIKLLGLVGPKVPLGDEVVIDSLKLRNGKKFMMLGGFPCSFSSDNGPPVRAYVPGKGSETGERDA